MKNLIYQYWDGDLTSGCKASVESMKSYASLINSDHLFEHNPNFFTELNTRISRYYGAFKPVYDTHFHQYDNVLVVDADVFAIEGERQSIFEGFNADIGVCTEPFQPLQRMKISGSISYEHDERWAKIIETTWNVSLPRTSDGLLKVYNSGIVLYSTIGLQKAKNNFIPFKKYIQLMSFYRLPTFYTLDQPYLHAMLKVAKMNYIELDNGWNSYIHYYYTNANKKAVSINDSRTPSTKLVHIQLRGADNYDDATLWRITNLPQEEWKIQHGHPCKLV